MALKVTMFFELDKSGWTEVYYTSDAEISDYTGTPPEDFKAGTKASDLIRLRRKLIEPDVKILRMRVSKVDSPQEFLVFDIEGDAQLGQYVSIRANDEETAEVYSSILLTLEAGAIARRKLWLGGLPEENLRGPQTYRPTSRFNDAMQVFVKHITSTPYAMRSRPIRIGNELTTITQFDVIGNGNLAVVKPIIRPAGNPAEWYVLVRGVKVPRSWNGVWRAREWGLVLGSMIIGPANRAKPSLPLWLSGPSGTVQLATFRYLPLTGWSIGSIRSRKRGRPFGQSRGRR